MKVTNIRDTLLFLALVSLPFVYNSCQKGFGSSNSHNSSSTTSTSCKVMVENGGVTTKVVFDGDQAPSPFATQKTALRASLGSDTPSLNKDDGSLTVPAGTDLAVILNNQCIQENRDSLDDTTISKIALSEGSLLPDLNRQAYLWKLDKDYNDIEIEAIAATEKCVIGISWNHQYVVQSTFNDPGYVNQVHFARVSAEAAYPKFYNTEGGMADTGTPVIVAVMDTGVDWSHPDLQGNFWVHQDGWGIDATTIPSSGAVNPPPINYNPYDVSPIGHGTHVAGLIAAISNNAVGTVGLMPKRAKIMAIKVFALDSGGNTVTSSQYFYNGVKFAYLNHADVLNISLGAIKAGPSADSLALAGFEEAVNNGTTVVTVIGNADSGNGGLVNGTTLSSIPGQYATMAGVMAVGSIDADTGTKSYFSHYSPVYSEIAAPGAKAGSSGLYSTKPVAMGGYGTLAGTSQAAPLVSAAAGLIYGIIRDAYGAAPKPSEVERLLEVSAKKDSALTAYFKDGNTLDLNRLANEINQDYTQTRSAYTQPVTLGCD